MSIEKITAYRATAAKLGEALAYTGTSPNGAAAIVSEAEEMAGGHLTPQGEGIGFFGNWRDHYNSFYGGWRWVVETAQLRLLVEAVLLEQENAPGYQVRWSFRKQEEINADVGRLVRAWREGAS